MDESARPARADSLALAQLFPASETAAGFVGIEQEYEVFFEGAKVDFRELIHTLAVDGVRVDPGDINAYRLPNGMALTCDEAEAELASPPIPLEPGFGSELVGWAAWARATLDALLPPGYSISGYSTHISISVPGLADIGLAEAYARSFAVPLSLLMERRDSLGLYVRPRPGRLELCGEFVEGRRLGAVAAFAAGSTRAALAGHLPPEVSLELLPCRERFGFRVHRFAIGADLYAEGREAVVSLSGADRMNAQQHLVASFELVARHLAEFGCSGDSESLGDIVFGGAALGVEAETEEPPRVDLPGPHSPHGFAGRSWQCRNLAIEPVLATWESAVFRVSRGRSRVYLALPASRLATFDAALHERGAGDVLAQALDQSPPPLGTRSQLSEAAFFTALPEDPAVLLAEEIPVDAGKTAGRSGKRGRVGKLLAPIPISLPVPPLAPRPEGTPPAAPQASPTARPPWSSRPVLVAVGVVVVALAVVAAVLANTSGGANEAPPPTARPLAVETSPPAPSATAKATETSTASPTPGVSPSAAAAATATSTRPPTETPQAQSTATPTPTVPATATTAPSPTVRPTETPRPTSTPTPTSTATATPTATPTLSALPTLAPTALPCTPIPGTTVCR